MSLPRVDSTMTPPADGVANTPQWPSAGHFTYEISADQLAILEAKARETAALAKQARVILQDHLNKRDARDEAGR